MLVFQMYKAYSLYHICISFHNTVYILCTFQKFSPSSALPFCILTIPIICQKNKAGALRKVYTRYGKNIMELSYDILYIQCLLRQPIPKYSIAPFSDDDLHDVLFHYNRSLCDVLFRRSLLQTGIHHLHHNCRLHSKQVSDSVPLSCTLLNDVQTQHLTNFLQQLLPMSLQLLLLLNFSA